MKQSALLLEKQLFACTLLEIIKLEKNIKTQSNYNIEYIPDIVNPSFSKAILDKKKH